ncbi:hypothetical protein L1987_42877 [Smallanthus sonchifolius]|uniref:Uncharacterized protein n=1 Tax=Smallanthus sonchifolius TaxID=185202 RepID=A0ACB9GL21_9ASTR|nr:hypothetical protein L1987_42877 [Smallanthus sonchifolius]
MCSTKPQTSPVFVADKDEDGDWRQKAINENFNMIYSPSLPLIRVNLLFVRSAHQLFIESPDSISHPGCYELVEEFGYIIWWKNGRGWYSTSSSSIYAQRNRRRKISRRPSDGEETQLAVSRHKQSAAATVFSKVNSEFRRV